MEENTVTESTQSVLPQASPDRSVITNEIPKKSDSHKKSPVKKAQTIDKAVEEDMPKPLTLQEMRKQRAEEARARLRREWEVESKMVTGVFRDLEVGPGGNLRFSAKKYPWDQVTSYNFVDGQTYTIPLWVARHLNENCKFPVYRHNVDPNAKEGEKVKQIVGQWNHRFAFVSSEFIGLAKAETPSLIVVGNQQP